MQTPYSLVAFNMTFQLLIQEGLHQYIIISESEHSCQAVDRVHNPHRQWLAAAHQLLKGFTVERLTISADRRK